MNHELRNRIVTCIDLLPEASQKRILAVALLEITAELTPPPPSIFEVRIVNPGSEKILVIKTLRELFGCSLVDSKNMAEAPNSLVFRGPEQERAGEIASKLESAGAMVTIQGVRS